VKRIASLAFALLILPSAASADSFSASFAGTGLGTVVGVSNGGSTFNVWAGQIKWDASGVDDFIAYCIDLTQAAQNTQQFTEATPGGISASDANAISYLVTRNFTSITTNWMAAGLQLAIWNVLYDSDYTVDYLSGGSFKSTSTGASAYANLFLADLDAQSNPTGTARFLDTRRGNGQDQVTVPEPATLLLLGAGFATLTARRRMRATGKHG
jgi:PEP-CTERM motif